jgi:hypothetical protein
LDLVRYFDDPTASAAFEKEHLMDVPTFRDRQQLFKHALREISSDEGLFLEFGVYKGNSINRLAQIKPNVTFYGFDSFVGLPEHWLRSVARLVSFTRPVRNRRPDSRYSRVYRRRRKAPDRSD